jgi:hypothetical protein
MGAVSGLPSHSAICGAFSGIGAASTPSRHVCGMILLHAAGGIVTMFGLSAQAANDNTAHSISAFRTSYLLGCFGYRLIDRAIRDNAIFDLIDRHFRSIGDSFTTAVRLLDLRLNVIVILAASTEPVNQPEHG